MEARRHFLKTLCMMAGLPFVGADAQAAPRSHSSEPAEPNLDINVLNFWEQQVRRKEDIELMGQHPDEDRIPEFVLFTEEEGFRAADEIAARELLERGDVDVRLQVQAFHPSDADRNVYRDLQSGSLRIDIEQKQPLPGLLEELAWVAVAAFWPDNKGQLPRTSDMAFDPGTAWGKLQSIPLPGGMGYWTWNFFLQRKESLWDQLIALFRLTDELVFPAIGLPAIASSALKALDRFLGRIQATNRTRWLYQASNQPIVATREALKEFSGLPLRQGQYLVIPRNHLSEFGKSVKGGGFETTKSGLVVPKGTTYFDQFSMADKSLLNVTYLSVLVHVSQRRPG